MPTFEYSRYDGTQVRRGAAAESAFDRLIDLVLEHGDLVLRQLDERELDRLLAEGLLERDGSGQLRVAPRGLARVEGKALEELFTATHKDRAGKHASDHVGSGTVRHEDTRAYQYGDPVAQLNLHETLKNALRHGGPIGTDDLVVYESENQSNCATVLLLDMSGSMARYGKFTQAKRVALGLQALIRGRYPEDWLGVVGFATFAEPLTERGLLLAQPKPVSILDSRVFVRVPLDRRPEHVPEHFTNIQAGLRYARQLLQRQRAANKQIILVTDGEPTAHLEGRELILVYPPGERTAQATLAEVTACRRADIQLSSFALIEDYFYLGLVNFVDQMARTARGVAVYCKAGELGRAVLERFVRGRRTRRPLG